MKQTAKSQAEWKPERVGLALSVSNKLPWNEMRRVEQTNPEVVKKDVQKCSDSLCIKWLPPEILYRQ